MFHGFVSRVISNGIIKRQKITLYQCFMADKSTFINQPGLELVFWKVTYSCSHQGSSWFLRVRHAWLNRVFISRAAERTCHGVLRFSLSSKQVRPCSASEPHTCGRPFNSALRRRASLTSWGAATYRVRLPTAALVSFGRTRRVVSISDTSSAKRSIGSVFVVMHLILTRNIPVTSSNFVVINYI